MNFPRIESTALLVVDLQERLVPAMNNPGPVLDRSRLLLRGMAELGVDVLVTEGTRRDGSRNRGTPAGKLPSHSENRFLSLRRTGFPDGARRKAAKNAGRRRNRSARLRVADRL